MSAQPDEPGLSEQLRHAGEYFAVGRFDAARALFEAVLARAPERLDVALRLAQLTLPTMSRTAANGACTRCASVVDPAPTLACVRARSRTQSSRCESPVSAAPRSTVNRTSEVRPRALADVGAAAHPERDRHRERRLSGTRRCVVAARRHPPTARRDQRLDLVRQIERPAEVLLPEFRGAHIEQPPRRRELGRLRVPVAQGLQRDVGLRHPRRGLRAGRAGLEAGERAHDFTPRLLEVRLQPLDLGFALEHPKLELRDAPLLGSTALTGNSKQLWMYNSSNLTTDINASGFFSDGANLGMKAGDIVIGTQYTSAGSSTVSFTAVVASISTAGAASLSTGGTMTSTFN